MAKFKRRLVDGLLVYHAKILSGLLSHEEVDSIQHKCDVVLLRRCASGNKSVALVVLVAEGGGGGVEAPVPIRIRADSQRLLKRIRSDVAGPAILVQAQTICVERKEGRRFRTFFLVVVDVVAYLFDALSEIFQRFIVDPVETGERKLPTHNVARQYPAVLS